MTTTLWNYAGIPQELRDTPNWVCWRLETSHKTGEMAKIPYTQGTDAMAKSNDPTTWRTFAEAKQAHLADIRNTGLGFMLSPPFVGGDCDHVVQDDTITDDLTNEIIETLDTYTEHSPSYKLKSNGDSTGLRWIGKGKLPAGRRKLGKYEMYDRVRFVTITGLSLPGRDTIRECQDAIEQVHALVFPPKPEQPAPAPSQPVDLDDQALIEMLRKCSPKFCKLYDHGDMSEYIGNDGKPDHSRADSALCSILNWATGNDVSRTDRLFRASPLMRPKWDSGRGDSTYGRNTIMNAYLR